MAGSTNILASLAQEILLNIKGRLTNNDLICTALTSHFFYDFVVSTTKAKKLLDLCPRQINYKESRPYSYTPNVSMEERDVTVISHESFFIAFRDATYLPTRRQLLMARLTDWMPRDYVLCRLGRDVYVRYKENKDWECAACKKDNMESVVWGRSMQQYMASLTTAGRT